MKAAFCLTTLLLLLAGCGSAEKFYRLSAEAPATTGGAALSLGVGPVTLPSYVDRAELVYQSGPNEFAVPTNARWAGSLRDNITQVLAADLGRLLGGRELLAYPWPAGSPPGTEVAIDIRQFHGISGNDAVLDFSWQLLGRNGPTSGRYSASLREPIHGDGYAAVVAAESRLLARAAEEIARTVRR